MLFLGLQILVFTPSGVQIPKDGGQASQNQQKQKIRLQTLTADNVLYTMET